jgi:acyl-CoA synthetase (AMP-forming)/AMP-acid ligase II
MMLDAYDPAAHDVSRLRFWLTAGAPIPAVLVKEAAARFSGCRVVPAYGSSEVMMATVCTPEDPMERVVSSDGRPVPGVELRIVAGGADAPASVEGEIRYRGPGRLVEYWGRSGPYRRGPRRARLVADRGHRAPGRDRLPACHRPDQGHHHPRRLQHQRARGGRRPARRACRQDRRGHRPDEVVGERVCAVLELAPGQDAPTLAGLRDYLTRDRGLAVWKVPERLEITDTWPVTATGKVRKHVLRDALRAGDG